MGGALTVLYGTCTHHVKLCIHGTPAFHVDKRIYVDGVRLEDCCSDLCSHGLSSLVQVP